MPLKTSPISLPGRRIIREAFEELQRVVSPPEAKEFQNTTLEDVQKAALDIENQLASRKMLRNMRRLMPLFQGLGHYSQSIEVLCNGTPYLPWIWAPIKLILTIASDFVEALERIVAAYSRIAESLPRMEMLSEAFCKRIEFQEILAIFYSDILTFHRHAYLFVRRSSWKIFFSTTWGRFQRRFDTILADIKAHEELVDKTANAVDILDASKMRESLRDQRNENLNEVAKQEDEDSIKQFQAIVGWLKMDDTDQQIIYDSIASEAEKSEGTCDWIFKQPTLVSWMRTQPETPFVWLQGNPGAGKSVLATQIDGFLRISHQSLVVRHFCTYSYASSIQFDQILRSLLLQLVQSNSDLINYLYQEFVLAKQAVTIKSLSQLVRTICEAISPIPSKKKYVHIILDGLDECDIEKQGRIMNLLETLISLGTSTNSVFYKILISGRPTPSLSKKFRKGPAVSLADEKDVIGKAIERYANQKLRLLYSRFLELGIRDTDIKELSQRISSKSDGMFLWARLVLEYLSSNIFKSRDEVLLSVDKLPRELSEFYERIFSQITARLDTRSMGRLKSLLGWIAFARRPLTQIECRSAMAFSEGVVETSSMLPPYIFEMCMPLIQENKGNTFSFIHVSIKDHLKSPESTMALIEADTRCEHGVASITCLLAGFRIFDTAYDASDRNLRILKGLHGFHIYATENWFEDLLCSNATTGDKTATLLCSTAKELAYRLNAASHSANILTGQELVTSDDRLNKFADQGAVYDMLRSALGERSTKVNIDQVKHESSYIDVTRLAPRNLKDLLASYQASIRSLLLISSFPGITSVELDKFKQDFRTAAFTCRVRNCPCATTGFTDEKKLSEHERRHVQMIHCTIPDCPYPPLPSSRALKAHVSKCHGKMQRIAKITRIRAQITRVAKRLHGADNTDIATERERHTFSRPPAINIDFAPTTNARPVGFEPPKSQMDQDSLTPPDRGRPKSRPRAVTDPFHPVMLPSPTPPRLLQSESLQSPPFSQHQFSSSPSTHSRHASLGPEAALLPNQIGDWTQPQFQGHRRTSDGITLNPFYEPLFGAPDVMRAGGQAATLVSNHGLQDYPGSASTAISGETATAMAHYTMDRNATQSVGGEIQRSIVQGTENTLAEMSGNYSAMSEDALLGAEQENNVVETVQISGIQENNDFLDSFEMRERNAGSNIPVSAEQETATMGRDDIQFGNLSPQGLQRLNNAAFNSLLTNSTPEQKHTINNLPPDKFNEFMRRWESQRQEQMANMNANPMMQQQMANRPQQFNQIGANMAPGPQNLQQVIAPGAGNQQQQHQAQTPQQVQQHLTPNAAMQVQMQNQARIIYNRLMKAAAAKFGGPEHVPQETVDKIKQSSFAQASQLVKNLLQRRAQQQQQQQQYQQQYQQQMMAQRANRVQEQTQTQAQTQAPMIPPHK